MAKRNKSKLKKRKQRQLKKAFQKGKRVTPENDYLPPYKEPKEDTNKKHEERNKMYQEELDKVYNGTVIPLNNYINPKCIILHKCNECGGQFYSRPYWLLTRDNQKHICGVDTARTELKNGQSKFIGGAAKKGIKRLGESEKLELYELFKAGMSVSKLTKSFNLSKYMVNKYLKEAGLK